MPPAADESPRPTESLVERMIVRERQYITLLASSSVCVTGSGTIVYNYITDGSSLQVQDIPLI